MEKSLDDKQQEFCLAIGLFERVVVAKDVLPVAPAGLDLDDLESLAFHTGIRAAREQSRQACLSGTTDPLNNV